VYTDRIGLGVGLKWIDGTMTLICGLMARREHGTALMTRAITTHVILWALR